MYNNYFLSKTLEIRKIGTNYCLYRSSDRTAWMPELAKYEEFWNALEIFSNENISAKDIEQIEQDGNLKYVVDTLIENNIFQKKLDITDFEKLNYSNYNNESYAYHLSSSRIDWTNYSDKDSIKKNDLDEMDSYTSEEEIPSNYKKYTNSIPKYYLEDFVKINLENNSNNIFFGKSENKIPKAIDIDDINLLINNSAKSYTHIEMYATGKHLRKNVPSGGARHPIEFYVLAIDIQGLEKGLYHYNVKFHRLDEIKITEEQLQNLTETVNIIPRGREKKLAASLIHTCIFKRSMFRYREPRSYRVMHYDLGHIHANEILISNILGLDYCETYSIPENSVESILGIDGFEEAAMSAFNLYGV